MEYRASQPTEHQLSNHFVDDDSVEQRLEALLNLNAEHARKASRHPLLDEEIEAQAMRFPLDRKETFAYFGSMLGSIPPVSIFLLLSFKNGVNPPPPLLIGLMLATVIVASITGYHSGKLVASASQKLDRLPLLKRIPLLAIMGLVWGIAAGAAGGAFMFIIGAIFGAFLGGVVGAVALPLFSIPYLAAKRGELIEIKHFLPISLGVTLTISAYILGFLYR